MAAMYVDPREMLDRAASIAFWVVVVISIAVLAMTGARSIWLALAGAGHDIALPSAGVPASEQALGGGDFTILERATPFREGPAEAVPTDTESIDAAETSLNLTLHGVLMGGAGGTAYISVGDAPQASFRVGDTLGSSRAQLERIYTDGVLLRRDGILEKLLRSDTSAIVTLGGEGPDAAPSTPEDVRETGSAPAQSDAGEAQGAAPRTQLRAMLRRSDVIELANSIRLDPNTGDVDSGYSVFPVRNADLMARAGLKPGDVVQRIGGVVLNDETDLARILANIENETELTVALVRGREPAMLVVRLSDG